MRDDFACSSSCRGTSLPLYREGERERERKRGVINAKAIFKNNSVNIILPSFKGAAFGAPRGAPKVRLSRDK
jgi:hypothetical protein